MEEERITTTKWHKKIVASELIKGTKTSWHWADLECGHRIITFGDLKITAGVALCQECQDHAAAHFVDTQKS